MDIIRQNAEFKAAVAMLNDGQSVFLTGKAGSGKTTLIKHVTNLWNGRRQYAITATTGVAAQNIGGATLHSQLALPIGLLDPKWVDLDIKSKIKSVILAMSCLIIDEAPMALATTLDYIDQLFREVRRNDKPFGGVQIILVGDLYQLPPIVRAEEESIMKMMSYESAWFFDSKVWQSGHFKTVQLNTVYRQDDQTFVDILNRVRIGQVTDDDLEILNERVGKPQEGAVILATKNDQVNAINSCELDKLSGAEYTYTADVDGAFSVKQCLAEQVLRLKVGTRVMCIANNVNEGYKNGDLGTVKSLTLHNALVTLDRGGDVLVEKSTWQNLAYTFADKKLQREIVGELSQLPLKQGWAVTVHKSQGLTFDKLSLDATNFFAAGQCYVALSRVRTLDGLSLVKPLRPSFIKVDSNVRRFFGDDHAPKQTSRQMIQFSGNIFSRAARLF